MKKAALVFLGVCFFIWMWLAGVFWSTNRYRLHTDGVFLLDTKTGCIWVRRGKEYRPALVHGLHAKLPLGC